MAGVQEGQEGMNPGSVSDHQRQLGTSYSEIMINVPNANSVIRSSGRNGGGCTMEHIVVNPLGFPGATSLS